MKANNREEQRLINHAISCELHNFITIYKGLDENRFVDFLNKHYIPCDENGNDTGLRYESVRSISENGEMKFAIFFNDGAREATVHSFASERVKNWLRSYLDICVQRVEWTLERIQK